ncbi:hypothetical protein HAV15_008068 [Penicillium sp. str. |nr:hypothetical protein HAV15_008068 [Penicillium sp. str. \
MFSGSSSPPKDRVDALPEAGLDPNSLTLQTDTIGTSPREKRFSPPSAGFFNRRQSEEQGTAGDKKRRSSTVTKAANFFSNAKSSLSLNGRDSSAISTSPLDRGKPATQAWKDGPSSQRPSRVVQ